MYDSLLSRAKDLSLQPALATDWSSNDAGIVWTFKLGQGVEFHDGTPFDADAVVKNFTRHSIPSAGLPPAAVCAPSSTASAPSISRPQHLYVALSRPRDHGDRTRIQHSRRWPRDLFDPRK
nr:ABC transporter substrate-binding protein [Rhizobium sp. BK418]